MLAFSEAELQAWDARKNAMLHTLAAQTRPRLLLTTIGAYLLWR
jgi:hypothetical protein